MILDKQLELSLDQSVAQIVGTYASDNIVDLLSTTYQAPAALASGQGARDIGINDKPMKVFVAVTTALVSAGGGTLQIHAQGAPDDGTGAASTYVTYASSALNTVANSIAGAMLFNIDWPRPAAGATFPRFIRLLYQVATATITAGKVRSYLVIDRQDQPISAAGYQTGYPPGLVVSN